MPARLHPRTEIRQAVIDTLQQWTAAGDRVVSMRVTPWQPEALPAIAVYTLRETVDFEQSVHSAPRVLRRVLDVLIEGAVALKADQAVEDAIDVFADQIERAMHRDEWFGRRVARSMLVSTELERSDLGDSPVGVVRMVYRLEYDTDAPYADDVLLQPLEAMHITYDLGGEQAAPEETNDELELEQ